MSDYQKSPITGHACFLGPGCDLWHRKNNVSITCGSHMAGMDTTPWHTTQVVDPSTGFVVPEDGGTNKPTYPGYWWFTGQKGLWRRGKLVYPSQYNGPVYYDGTDIDIIASDEPHDVEDFDGEFFPLSEEIVKRGQQGFQEPVEEGEHEGD